LENQALPFASGKHDEEEGCCGLNKRVRTKELGGKESLSPLLIKDSQSQGFKGAIQVKQVYVVDQAKNVNDLPGGMALIGRGCRDGNMPLAKFNKFRD